MEKGFRVNVLSQTNSGLNSGHPSKMILICQVSIFPSVKLEYIKEVYDEYFY